MKIVHKEIGILISEIITGNSEWSIIVRQTRTKTSIRYAKENDKEKRERRKEKKR